MSAKELKKKEEEREPQAAPVPERDAKAPPAGEGNAPGLAYKFKFAPADPKNAFDFEDVADK